MLQGSLVALVTPFNPDGGINFPKLGELLEFHIKNGTDGIVILGTTAEATTLSLQEQEDIVRFSVDVVGRRVPIIVGAGSNDTLAAVNKARLFSSLGADYLLVITPYYNKTNDEGLIKHFEVIAQSSLVPIILYNVPSRTGMSIPASVISRLSQHPNIYGIKEASGNMSYAASISKYLSDDFIMLSGNDDIIVPMMSIGAKGVISVLANICPRGVSDICHYALDGNFYKANNIAKSLLDVANALFYETNPIPVKEAMNYLGFNVGGFRLPLYQMGPDNYRRLIDVIDRNKEWLY